MVLKGVPKRTFSFQFKMILNQKTKQKYKREIVKMFRFYICT